MMEEELQKEGIWKTLTPAKPIPERPPRSDYINSGWSNHMGQSSSAGISIDKNRGLYNWDGGLASNKQNASEIEAGVTIDLKKSVLSLGFEDTSRGCSTNVLNDKHSHNETCIGPISSGGMEGTNSAGLDDCGSKLVGLKGLLVFSDAAPQASETSVCAISEGLGGLKSGCFFPASHSHFDSSSIIKTQNILASANVTLKSYSQIGNCMNTQIIFSTNNDPATHPFDRPYQVNEKDEVLGVGNEGSKLHNDEKSQHGDGLASTRISTPSPSEKRNARKGRNSGIDLDKKPRKRTRMIKHRPKVVVEGKPRKAPKPQTPKPRTPKSSTPKPRTPKSSTSKPRTPKSSTPKPRTPKLSTPIFATTMKIPHGSELAAKSCRRTLNFSLENQPRDDNGREIVASKKDKKRKYVRKTSLKENLSEDADRQSVHPDNEHAQKSCEQALSFKLENQVRDEHNVKEIITVNTSLDEKVRKNILKGSTNSSKDANEQAVDPSSENAGISCRQDLKCNMENQEFGKKDVRQIVYQYQRKASRFTHSESCIRTMSLAQRGAATYQKNPLATNQIRYEHKSLQVYQRIFQANQCLKNSRKLGPNFPRLYKKKRMRRQKATVFDALGSIMVALAEAGQRQVKAHSWTKMTVERHSTLRTTKRTTQTRTFTQRRKHEVVANSEENCNSAIDSYNSYMRNTFVGMLSPMDEQIRAAADDPESFKCVLSLCPTMKFKRKRSKRFIRTHNLVVPTTNPFIEEQMRSTTDDSESFKCVLALCPVVKAKRKRSKRFSRRHKNLESKASVDVQFAENQNVVTKEENIMGSLYDNKMPCHNEIEGDLLKCGEDLLEFEMCPPQHEDVDVIRCCLRQQKNVMLDIEDRPLQREDVVLDVEPCAPQHEDVLLTGEYSVDASVEELVYYITHRLGCFHLSNDWGQLVVRNQNDRGALVPYGARFDPSKKPKFMPKVDLDPETTRVWKLLMENDGSEVTEETDKDKEKWWDEQREIFRGRVDSFIARMHSIQGDRRFSPWKGSVVDSVVGAFLTQNVSDHLSSSAFLSLAARFPIQSTRKDKDSDHDDGEIACSQESFGSNVGVHGQASNTSGEHSFVCETEMEMSNQLAKNGEETLVTRRGCAISDAASRTIVKDEFPLQIFSNSSDGNPATTCQPCTTGSTTTFREILQLQETEFLKNFYSRDGNMELGVMENDKERSSSDKLSDLKSSYEPVYSPSSHNSCSENPLTHKKLDLDSLDLMGDIKSGAKNELGAISRNLGLLELFGSETIIQQKVIPRAQDATTVNPYVSLGKCQVSHACSLQSEVMTEKNVHPSSNDHQGPNKMISRSEKTSRNKKSTVAEKQAIDWEGLRKTYSNGRARETSANTMDSVNWEGVRCSTVEEVSATIKGRGMNNVLAKRIKDFLDRLVKDHGSIDLEWLRDFPPDKAKEYLLSIPGLGLKSVECIRLLTLHHLAFPVDTNVGRVMVRLGWVPLQTLPEEIQLHLLNQYPVMDTIQKYLWTRLCALAQLKLYTFHYQLITFGKVFCTKKNPNCNACPMRGECRHFASAFASARLSLPGSKGKSIVTSKVPVAAVQDPAVFVTPQTLFLPDLNFSESGYQTQDCEPIIEIPASPEPERTETLERDIEDFHKESEDEIPTIVLNNEEFRENVIKFMENTLLHEGDMSKALVAISAKASSIPMPKLKYVSRLRTVFQVYELPDSHPLLEKFERREPDDPSPYLLAIWTPGKTENTSDRSKKQCGCVESEPCNENTCFSCNSIEEQTLQTVCGTILIPCRTATRGSFPLNGTYFQVNEVFADHESSQHPINVPRAWIWNLPRRTLYCGTSATSIFRGRTTEEIQYSFWRGFICVRAFNRTTRAPRHLAERFHVSTTSAAKTKQKDDE